MNLSTKNTDGTWTAGVEYYYIRNAQGDIIGLYDGNGTQVVSYSYDSWGKLISIKDGSDNDITNDTTSVGFKNPYRYRGYRYDNETSLYYLQSRYYNAEWCRFINADGLAGAPGELLAHNMFVYCKGDPINKVDHTGLLPVEINNWDMAYHDGEGGAFNPLPHLASFVMDFSPLDFVKDSIDFIKGKDSFTGESQSRLVLGAAVLLPGCLDATVKSTTKAICKTKKFIPKTGIWKPLGMNRAQYVKETGHSIVRKRLEGGIYKYDVKDANRNIIGTLHQGQKSPKVVPDHIHYNWDTENIHHMLDD